MNPWSESSRISIKINKFTASNRSINIRMCQVIANSRDIKRIIKEYTKNFMLIILTTQIKKTNFLNDTKVQNICEEIDGIIMAS